MPKQERIILIKGEDKTQQIKTLNDIGSKIKIVFHNDPKTYFYNKKNVKIIHSTLSNLDAKNCFNYLKDIAKAIGLLTPEGDNILSQHYSRIDFIREDSILSSYLTSTFNPVPDAVPLAIFPFGFNTSQKAAVEKALTYSQSVIQGPPGTGKTQTILNIIANAIMQGKTVAVVSNKQMDNSQLTVDMLIRPFYISRTEFFVKLKRLTGFSPQEFITQMRARHAAKLIVTSDYQMKEIAAMIGLDNGHYFSRFFKKVYGMTPMEYKKTHGTQSPE